jgi:hypothetical protein
VSLLARAVVCEFRGHDRYKRSIVDNLEGTSAQEIMIRGIEAINRLLAAGVG